MKPYIFAVLTSLIWGCVPVIEKTGLAKIPVWTGVALRCLGIFMGVALLILFKFPSIKSDIASGIDGWPYLVLGGFLASIVGQLTFYSALKSGEVSKVTPIAATYPLISFLIGVLFFKESLTLAKAGGLVFVLIGVVLLR